ncbi:MAG: TonB-dependent receptor [Bacteroidales bacterium]|nr:TonB-dependent receptor [Bacteroidales bacterium]
MKKMLSLLILGGAMLSISAQTDSVISLKDQVVTGARQITDIRHLPMTVSVVNRDVLTENVQPSILPTLMQEIPGLTVTSRGMMGYGVSGNAAGGINMRGLSGGSGQMMVLIDGHPQYQGIYGHPIADSYQTGIAERVEVLRGPASVLYGSNAMGGVVNIVTRRMDQDGSRTHLTAGAGSYGTVQGEISHQQRQGRFSGTASALYNRSDNHRPRMGFEQYGGYLKGGYELSEHWKLSADANLNHFNASHPGTVSSPLYDADQWITRGFASMALDNHYGGSSGSLSLYTNFGQHKIDDGTADPTAPTVRYFRSRDYLAGVSLYQSMQLLEGNRLTAGVDYQHIYGHAYYTSKATGEELPTTNKQSGESHRNDLAAYIDIRQDLFSWMTLDAGIRVDHHSVTGTEWIPQAGLVFRLIEDGTLKAMAGKGFRNPTMREMYLYPPSNEELEPERTMNYELSWKQYLLNDRLSYGINLYYIKGDNLIVTNTTLRKNVNTGEIENYGVEAEASWQVNRRISLRTNHAYLHMEAPVLSAPEYVGFAGVRYELDPFSMQLGLQYVDNLYTAVGASPRKESFCLLNATLGYQVTRNLKCWVRGENLLDQEYEIIVGDPMPGASFMAGVIISL